jgi:hypothetical protein
VKCHILEQVTYKFDEFSLAHGTIKTLRWQVFKVDVAMCCLMFIASEEEVHVTKARCKLFVNMEKA